MRKSRVTFTSEEDNYIIKNHLNMTNSEIGVVLNRPKGTIFGHKKLLLRDGKIQEIKNFAPPVTQNEYDFLKTHLWDLGVDECADRLNRPYITIYSAAKRLKLPLNPIFRYENRQDISHFTSPLDPFVIYFLGYVWADGDITSEKNHRIKLKINTPDFNDIKDQIYRLGDFWHYNEYKDPHHSHWKPMSVLDAVHLELWRFLELHDYRIKSGTSADKILSLIPLELRNYWWRGYFDGDGCISRGHISFNSELAQDWTFVHNLGKELDIQFAIERKDRITRAGSKASISNWTYMNALIDYLYQGEIFGLARKRIRCMDYLDLDIAKKPNLTSQYRGVCWDKRRKTFVMQIAKGAIYKNIRFDTEIDAARAYDIHAKQFFGDKAILNFT